jgi:hypothetical protein
MVDGNAIGICLAAHIEAGAERWGFWRVFTPDIGV